MSSVASPTHALPTESADMPPVDLDRPILICGVGRSGTSLLQSMLNAHPDISIPPETHFFRRYIAARATRRKFEAGGVESLARTLRADESFGRAEAPVDDVLADQRDGAIDLVHVYRRMLGHRARREGKARVGDKDPRNLDFLPELAAAFPRALVLHIVRDPRAVVHSRMKASWSAGRPWRSHAFVAQEQLRRGRLTGRALFGARYVEIRYEALAAEPRETLMDICQHIDLPFDAAMLDFGASARTLVAQDEMAWKKETLGPLLANNDAKWRDGLKPEQVSFIESVCVEAFDHAGYEREMPYGSMLDGIGHRTARTLARIAYGARLVRETRR